MGAVIGFLVAAAQFVILIWLSIVVERRVETPTTGCAACLLRLVALLGLAFSTGIGYLIGKWYAG